MEQERVCQFYIVLGEKAFRPPNDGNVYINATGVLDNQLIWDSISRMFRKKANEKVKVGNEIIFLVPNMSLGSRCQEIMDALNIQGRIELFSSFQKEMVLENEKRFVPKSDSNRSEEELKDLVVDKTHVPASETSTNAKIVELREYQKRLIEEQNRLKEQNQLNQDTIGMLERGSVPYFSVSETADIPLNANDGGSSRVGAGGGVVQKTNTQGKVKTLVKKPPKSAAFISMPVIIFVLSALLLIASIVLLFVVE